MAKYLYKGFTLIEIMIVVAIIAILLAIGLPNYIASTKTSKRIICVNNLKQIDTAMDQWAMANSIPSGTQPAAEEEDEIYGYVQGLKPQCPSRGVYTLAKTGDNPQVTCSLESEGHTLTQQAD
jgi:prepilin-type N-terminal cleavage/methylation domain-containing protein